MLKRNRQSGHSFVIEIKETRNDNWQGILTWVEEQEKIPFRSTLELIRLMDSAITDSDKEKKNEEYDTESSTKLKAGKCIEYDAGHHQKNKITRRQGA